MSEIIKDQLQMIVTKIDEANDAQEAKNYGKTIQLLNEAGVLILAAAVGIQKLTSGE